MSPAGRQERTEALLAAASGKHPLVAFVVDGLEPADADADPSFGARKNLARDLEQKLRALGATDALVTAVFALAELLAHLQSAGGAAAGEVSAALKAVTPLVTEAIAALPPEELVQVLAANPLARFSGDAATANTVERRPPKKGEAAGGLLARAAFATPPKKKR